MSSAARGAWAAVCGPGRPGPSGRTTKAVPTHVSAAGSRPRAEFVGIATPLGRTPTGSTRIGGPTKASFGTGNSMALRRGASIARWYRWRPQRSEEDEPAAARRQNHQIGDQEQQIVMPPVRVVAPETDMP